jgi:hypothetical protein
VRKSAPIVALYWLLNLLFTYLRTQSFRAAKPHGLKQPKSDVLDEAGLRVWPYWFISDVFPTLTTEEERKRRRDQKNSGKITPENTKDKGGEKV